ncbi:MAG: response regulator [Magnetococcales bacterium]|nr:response regulator [Magnetococcales bacterium]NGZ07186.1 response regulator [Magnetococcales bacterium]
MALTSTLDQNPLRCALATIVDEDGRSKQRLRTEIQTLHQAAEITADLVIRQFEKTEAILARFQSTSAQLQAVLDAATQIAIIATDLNGMITLFNRGAERMLGYQATEMIGHKTPLDLLDPEELTSRAQQIRTPDGQPLEGLALFAYQATTWHGSTQEWNYRCQDGHFVPVSLSITALQGADRKQVGFLWVAMDISTRKEAEEQLRRGNEELQRLDKLKSDLLSSVSHELRTPLTSIRGFAQLIRREFDRTFAAGPEDDAKRRTKSQRIQENLEIILTESERLTRLINTVLDLAKIESGRIEWHKSQFPVQEAIRQAVNAVQGQFATLTDVRLETEMPTVSLLIEADKDRLVQVLVNLLNNAAKFITTGHVRVTARDQKDGTVCVEVEDTGCGFPQDQAESIFDKFQQVRRSDTLVDKPQGTGLGLSICKEIVHHHGGRIWATSEPGRGSLFAFTLPLIASSATDEPEMVLAPVPTGSVEITPPPMTGPMKSGPLVLVVDDDPNVCTYLNQLFHEQGYRVVVAANGQEGLELARRNPPDLITLDLAMPVMDGRQTMALLHQDPMLQRVPVVILSAMPDFDQVGGAVAMSKPIDEQRLLHSMRWLLSDKVQDGQQVESLPCLVLNEPVALAAHRLPAVIRLGEVTYCTQEELLRLVGAGFKGLVTVPTEALSRVERSFWEQLSTLDVLILPAESAAQRE